MCACVRYLNPDCIWGTTFWELPLPQTSNRWPVSKPSDLSLVETPACGLWRTPVFLFKCWVCLFCSRYPPFVGSNPGNSGKPHFWTTPCAFSWGAPCDLSEGGQKAAWNRSRRSFLPVASPGWAQAMKPPWTLSPAMAPPSRRRSDRWIRHPIRRFGKVSKGQSPCIPCHKQRRISGFLILYMVLGRPF